MKNNNAKIEAHDYGASGMAAKLRPTAMFSMERKSPIKNAPLRIDVVRYVDSTLFDRMHARGQLSDRQQEACYRLSVLWTAAGLNPSVCADYGVVGENTHDDDMPESAPTEGEDGDATALDRYRKLMRETPPAYVLCLDAMLAENHPGTQRLPLLQSACDWLADRWGLEKIGSGY